MLEATRGRQQLNEEVTDMKAEYEDHIQVHEEFTYISGIATQVLKCGPWRDLWKTESSPQLLILVIPGNPGLAGFYRTFIRTLYLRMNQQYPVWAVSHGGHCKLPHGMEMVEGTDGNEVEDPFGLRGQIEHKLNFLKQKVPKDVKLLLIGHSMGCYIALEILKCAPELEILRSILLFPTIERMAQSPQGKLMTPLFCQLRYILYIPIYLVTLLPNRAKSSLVRFGFRGFQHCDDSALTTSVELIDMRCIGNVLYLASQEMREIVERDNSTIKEHLKKLTFYYGSSDAWCPIQYYEEMKMEFPNGDIRLCEKGFRHAFVLESSKEMAGMVADWVKDDLTKL